VYHVHWWGQFILGIKPKRLPKEVRKFLGRRGKARLKSLCIAMDQELVMSEGKERGKEDVGGFKGKTDGGSCARLAHRQGVRMSSATQNEKIT